MKKMVDNTKEIIRKMPPFLRFLGIYLLVILVVSPWKNFPINDDWDNQLQIMAFQQGDHRIHSLIDAAFILQPWTGYFWALFFGNSFVSLRVLTILFSIGTAYVLHLLLKNHLSSRDSLLVLLVFFVNPLMLSSTLSFMTEIYFLFASILGYYFYDKYFSTSKSKYAHLGSLVTGMSILMRQLGFVLFIAFLISYFLKKKRDISVLLFTLISAAIFIFIWQVYPRAGIQEPFIYSFIEPQMVSKRLASMLFIFPLLGFSLVPLFFTHKRNLKSWKTWLFYISVVLLAYQIFLKDVLPLGNVFYVECLNCRTRYRPSYSLFDNQFFKIFLSFVISFSLIELALQLLKYRKQIFKKDIFTLLIILGYYTILFFPEDIYDRYALPFVMYALIYIVRNFKIQKVHFVTSLVVILMGVFLNWEFFRSQELIYTQTNALYQRTDLLKQMYTTDTFIFYQDALRNSDYLGENTSTRLGRNNICNVQQYYLEDSQNVLYKVSSRLEKVTEKYIDNPDIYNRSKKTDVKKIKKHLDELVYNERYFSFLYDLVGKKAYVGSFCDESVTVHGNNEKIR